MDKAELRRHYRQVRGALPAEETTGASRAIAERFFKDVGLQAVKSAHIYGPMARLGEVDTAPIISRLTRDLPNVELIIGAGQPDQPPPQRQFDLIVVPLVAFDKQRQRLGLGGGWYDQFLAAQPGSLKVGLAYDAQLYPGDLPAEPHDIQLDKIITPTETY